jgi:hypothetical protein
MRLKGVSSNPNPMETIMTVAAKKTVKKTVKKTAKKTVKKTAKKTVAAKKNGNGVKRKDNTAIHEKLISLFKKPNGCTLTEVRKTGYRYPTMLALKVAKDRYGLKVKATKKKGELTRYYAWA